MYDIKGIENILNIEIATKSWYDNYFKFIIDNLDKKLDWMYLSKNPNITFDNVKKTLDDPRFKWNWLYLSKNPNIKFDDIKENIYDKRFKWDWFYLSENPNILRMELTMDIVLSHPNKPW